MIAMTRRKLSKIPYLSTVECTGFLKRKSLKKLSTKKSFLLSDVKVYYNNLTYCLNHLWSDNLNLDRYVPGDKVFFLAEVSSYQRRDDSWEYTLNVTDIL